MKFKACDGWDGPTNAAKKKGKSILVWIDHEDGTLSQYKMLPDGRHFWIRDVRKEEKK